MPEMNPVIWIFGIFLTLAGCAGFWAFLSLFINRKAELKNKDSDSLGKFEEASASLREDLLLLVDRQETTIERKDEKIDKMRDAFIPVLDAFDDLAPKIWQCIDESERTMLRERVNMARRKL